jgi:purine-nucleoside phosphorylase
MPMIPMMLERVEDGATDLVRARLGALEPRIALILGSGLGGLVRRIEGAVEIPFADIPGFPRSDVEGHAARLVGGTFAGRDVLAFAGRYHLYEGHSAAAVALPVRLARALGVRTLFVSNAAGGIRRTFRAGDLMLIHDHINLMWQNPLVGPVRDGELRFPDMSQPYDPVLLAHLRDAALDAGVPIVEGIYAGLLGPSYETPAEIRMLERIGADAVGMSTVPEVIAARALGMRVAGISCVTNVASGMSSAVLSHAEVLDVTERVKARFERLVTRFVERIDV